MKQLRLIILISGMILINMPASGQDYGMSFYRPADFEGLNVFETFRDDMSGFDGLKVRVGGNFTQQYQSLSHENEAAPNVVNETDVNRLYPLGSGFNLASANLNIDVQLEDGIRMSLESYMSSRNHPEFWVKGGYIQIDKLPFFGDPLWFERHVSVRVGHTMFNYGDQHFRRSDNGRTFHNPFVGNLIMDAFTTEIGGELYLMPSEGNYFLMLGMTGGLISGDVREYEHTDKSPSMLAKLGYDEQFSDDLRFRLSASLYTNAGTTRNTLYAGDRAGSRYYMAMEPEYFINFRAGGAITASNEANRFTSGRFSPDFTHSLTSVMINPFVKFRGLELFGTYEISNGTHNAEIDDRSATQLAGELVYRFLPGERAFLGARYNTVSAGLPGENGDVSIDRIQLSAGWYTTKNLLVKLEYVNQSYNDFAQGDYRHGGSFNGLVIEAAVAF